MPRPLRADNLHKARHRLETAPSFVWGDNKFASSINRLAEVNCGGHRGWRFFTRWPCRCRTLVPCRLGDNLSVKTSHTRPQLMTSTSGVGAISLSALTPAVTAANTPIRSHPASSSRMEQDPSLLPISSGPINRNPLWTSRGSTSSFTNNNLNCSRNVHGSYAR